MILSFYLEESDVNDTINLSELIDANESVDDVVTLAEAIRAELHAWLEGEGASEGVEVKPLGVIDDNDNELEVDDSGDWIEKVAQFAWFINVDLGHLGDVDQVYAWVDGQGWRWTIFDEIKDYGEEFYGEYDGDAEEFARAYLGDVGDLPPWMQDYFDYESYGEALLQGYYEYEWNGRTFLYYR